MPITFQKSYLACDGKCYAKIEEAQAVEIMAVIDGLRDTVGPGCSLQTIVDEIITHKDAIANILTLTDTSHPRARGVKRGPRKPKVAPEAKKAA